MKGCGKPKKRARKRRRSEENEEEKVKIQRKLIAESAGLESISDTDL